MFFFYLKSIIPSILIIFTVNLYSAIAPQSSNDDIIFEINNSKKNYSTVACLTLVIGKNNLIDHIAKIVKNDLEFSDQMTIKLNRYQQKVDTFILNKILNQGYSLCLSLEEIVTKKNQTTNQCSINVILRDTYSNQECYNKIFLCTEKTKEYNAHCISDALIPILTGQKGPMLSTLAYCKRVSPRHTVICISDYACRIERAVVKAKTINVAPCWHSQAPVLFYSQFTWSNSRLMSYDLRTKNHKIICSYDGLNMQPSFSPDGSKAVLCLSGKGNSELYLYDQSIFNRTKKRMFQPITNNKGNNASPCYLPNGNIVFCSDFQSGIPQIYLLDMKKNTTSRLTSGRGYCAAPSYCALTNNIAYTRYAKGIFQIFTLSLNSSKPREQQLTNTPGDKLEPTISECGRFIAFTYAHNDKKTKKITNQIAVLNTISGKMRILTHGKEHKSFPAWTNRPLYIQ